MGQLCDDDCTAIFSKHHCTIYSKNNQPVITGIRNHTTGLYEQHIPTHNNKNDHQENATYQQPTYRNISNIFTNVLSPQQPEHGSKLLKRATSKHGPVSPSRQSNTTYQNQKPPRLGIWINKEKTHNQQN